MTAPTEHGRYLGYWRLTGPHMRRKFGQRVWCHVQVVDPSQSGAEAFDDLQGVLAEIEKKKEAAGDEGAGDEAAGEEAIEDEMEMAKAMSLKAPEEAEVALKKEEPTVDIGDAAMVTKELVTKEPPAEEEPTKEAVVPASVVSAEMTKVEAKAEAEAEEPSKDGTTSDDGVLVTDGMLAEPTETPAAAAGKAPVAADEAAGPSTTSVREALVAMGFNDVAMIDVVVDKHGEDVEACARDLAAATEWDSLLDDLAEMGFNNYALNKTLMLKNNGNIKKTVRDLVEA